MEILVSERDLRVFWLLSGVTVLVMAIEVGQMTFDLALVLFFVSLTIFLLGLSVFIWRLKQERERVETIPAMEKEALMRRVRETLDEHTARLFKYGFR